MCAGAGAGAVNFQMLGAGAVSAPAPALRGLCATRLSADTVTNKDRANYHQWAILMVNSSYHDEFPWAIASIN